MRVLDIATGIGLTAEAAAEAVGPTGHVLAADISPAMVARARDRLGERPNVAFAVEDAQALTLADHGFDAVICNMGLTYLPDPALGLTEFSRVLRPGGRLADSVFTRADRALVGGLVRAAIARLVPAKRWRPPFQLGRRGEASVRAVRGGGPAGGRDCHRDAALRLLRL
jgi:ubiquinone/menaquinone biosynthesis C-methylase UbiE